MSGESLVELRTRIVDATKTVSGIPVAALLTGSLEHGNLIVPLEPGPFLELLSNVHPCVVYVHSDVFEAENDTLDAFDAEDDEAQALREDKRFRALVRRWASRDGELSNVVASFVKDGVIHILMAWADWHDEYEGAVDKLKFEISQEFQDRQIEIGREGEAEIRRLAKELAKHPKFSGSPKPSREKRMFLAETLFPGRSNLFRIVDMAINMDWLEEDGRY